MRVQLDGERVVHVSKGLHLARSHGEYAGVSLLRPAAARLYGDICNGLEWSAKTHIYYEDVYEMMLERIPSRAADVGPGEYAEVDTPADVAAALQVADSHF
jgi:choline kinase